MQFFYFKKETGRVVYIQDDIEPRITNTHFVVAAGTLQLEKDKHDYIITEQHFNVDDGNFGKYQIINNSVQYVNVQDEIQDKWKIIRNKRDSLLEKSDDESMIKLFDYWALQSEAYKNNWLRYRQDLRDITSQEDPDNITWPTHPDDVTEEVTEDSLDSA